jgi:hypothetical protein
MDAVLRFRFAFSSVMAVAAVSMSAACSSGDSTGSSGNSGASTSGSSGTGSTGSGSGTTGTTGSGSGTTGTTGSGSGTTGSTGSGSGTTGSSGATGTTVSFSSTIVPIFQSNCTTGGIACHGDPGVTTQAQKRPYLGPQAGATVPAATLATIGAGLMVSSAEDPSMPLVSPGSDTNSFLMHKVDNTLGSLDCSKGDDDGTCGLAMPYTAAMLPQTTRDTIRAWINGGAPLGN